MAWCAWLWVAAGGGVRNPRFMQAECAAACHAAPSLPEDTRRFAPHDGVPAQAAAPSVGQQVKLSAEDEQALTTLAEFGPFSREQRIEAYLACNRDEMLAANFLMDHQ